MAIYISKGLYTSGALNSADFNANNPVIGYKNYILQSGISATSERDDFPASNVFNTSTAEYWESEIDTVQYLEFNINISAIDYVGIAAHNLSGMEYEIEYKVGAGGTWTAVESPLTPSDNSAIVWYFEPILADFWRIKITPTAGNNPKIGVVYIGEATRLQRRVYVGHTPIVYGRKTNVTTGMSENGDYLGRIVKNRSLSSSVKQNNITASFYRSVVEPFVKHADVESKPYFFAWRPSSYPLECGYCWNTSNIVPQNERPNGMMDFSISMRAHAPWV
jgi:hypothetical protein